MVEKLYLENSYKKNSYGTITQINGNCVQLDKTIFYAFSGGQISDIGTIEGKKVIEARKLSDIDIEYELENIQNLSVGDEVEININWDHRYELMKLHSAQHIVADFFEQLTGINTTLGGNIRNGKATLTYPIDETITELLIKVEKLANEFISQNHEIKRYPSSNPNRWIYQCGDFPCECGGTHVKNTSEIGKIKLKRKNGGKGKETIEVMIL